MKKTGVTIAPRIMQRGNVYGRFSQRFLDFPGLELAHYEHCFVHNIPVIDASVPMDIKAPM
jgi:hypothetical protein